MYLTSPGHPTPQIPYPRKDMGPGTRKGPGTKHTLPPPPVDRMTHVCENSTLTQLPWQAVITSAILQKTIRLKDETMSDASR